MTAMNDIGISRRLDWPRIRKLLAIGLVAAFLHLTADLLLAWDREDEALDGIMRMLSAYAAAPDGRIFAAALLGLFGVVLEGLSCFGIYHLMAEKTPKYAHRYRSGIFGYLMFGACGFHVPVCAAAFLLKHGLAQELLLKYGAYFLLPSLALFWIFFLVLAAAQIGAFRKGLTPYPRWCWVFSMPFGMLVYLAAALCGNHPLANALRCAWLSIGCLWMFGGLLVMLPKAQKHAEG